MRAKDYTVIDSGFAIRIFIVEIMFCQRRKGLSMIIESLFFVF